MIKIIRRLMLTIMCVIFLYGMFPVKTAEAATDMQAGWSTPDKLNDNAIKISPSENLPQPTYVSDSSGLYSAWAESNGSYTVIRVKKYDGSNWTPIENGGLNKNGLNAVDPFLTIYNGTLYCAWREPFIKANTTQFGLYIMRYDGDNKWSRVDDGKTNHADKGESDSGLCFSSSAEVKNAYLLAHGGYLYAAWDEKYPNASNFEIHVKRFNGTTWEAIDGGSEKGINGNYLNIATAPHLAFYGEDLYAAWQEKNANSSIVQLVVKKYQYNSSSGKYEWIFVDGKVESSGEVTGIIVTKSANKPKLCIMNNTIYAAWIESNYVHISSYNTSTGKWNSSSILSTVALAGGRYDLTVYNNCMYIACLQLSPCVTHVYKYDGTNITNLTDTSNSYISSGSVYSNNPPALDIYNQKLYVTWVEGTMSAGYNIISRNMAFPYISNSADSIIQGSEDGKLITVSLTGGSFVDTLKPDNWTVTNLPDGVTKGSVTRVNNNTVTIALSGNSTSYTTSDITDIKVSCTADEYKFPIEGSLTTYAGITIKAKTCNITVAQTGLGSVALNGTSLTANPFQAVYKLGTPITLSASANAGYHFAYWTNPASGTILSTSTDYSFTTGTDLSIEAVFQPDLVGSYYVLFKDPFDKILNTETVEQGKNATSPAAPYILGYEFIGWDKSLMNITSDITITAQFRRLATTYKLTLSNGTISGTGNTEGDYQYDTLVTIVANPDSSGQQFAYWTWNDVIISRSATYSLYMPMDSMTLTAVYEASPSAGSLIALFPTAMLGTDVQSLQFIANRDVVPAGYTLIESGILLYKGSLSGDLTLNTSGIIVTKIKNTSTKQFFVRKDGILAGELWYARAYMMYMDAATGRIITVYSPNTVNKTT